MDPSGHVRNPCRKDRLESSALPGGPQSARFVLQSQTTCDAGLETTAWLNSLIGTINRIDEPVSSNAAVQGTASHCVTGRYRVREIPPQSLARILGWNVLLKDLAPRMRCSRCGRRAAEVVAVARPRPRGVPKNPH